MSLILPANSLTGGYEIDNSLRFRQSGSTYLERTLTTEGNRKTWTWSGWVKRGLLGFSPFFQAGESPGTTQTLLGFSSTNTLRLYTDNTSSSDISTTQVFRDISAWYHIVVAIDTTQATASNRVKMYVNGTQVTAFSTASYPAQNLNTEINKVTPHRIGKSISSFYDGYLTEVNFIDGQALTPTDFGEFDEDSGIWIPKKYTGTYGTNGFYLDFENSGSLGADQSGNGNNFTVNNLTSIDQTTDTPTNNFATGNPLIPSTLTYSDGNLTIQRTTTNWESTGSTLAVTQGKWYAEFKWISGTFCMIGTEDINLVSSWDNEFMGYTANGRGYGWDGNARNNGSSSSYGTSYSTGDIIGVALDMDNKFVYFSKNGTFQNSGDPTSGASGTGGLSLAGTEYVIGWSAYNSVISANFGSPPFTISSGNSDGNGIGLFEYLPPTGYLALCTANLATDG